MLPPPSPQELEGALQLVERWRRAEAADYIATVQELGAERGILFQGLFGTREFFVPVPLNLRLLEAGWQLRVPHSFPVPARSSLELLVDDRPSNSFRLSESGGTAEGFYPVQFQPRRTNQISRLSFLYNAAVSDDRCFDSRLGGNFAVVEPDSYFRLRYDPRSVTDVRTATIMLPRTVLISVSAARLTQQQYEAAWRIATALRLAGYRVRFNRLPALGQQIFISHEATLQTLREAAQLDALVSGRTRSLDDATSVTIDSDTFLGAWLMSANASDGTRPLPGERLGDIVIADGAELDRLRSSLRGFVAALDTRAQGSPSRARLAVLQRSDLLEVVQTVDPRTTSSPNLALLRLVNRPILALTEGRAVAAAQFLGEIWRQVALRPEVDVAVVQEWPRFPTAPNRVTFNRLGIELLPFEVGARGDVDFGFNFRDLPPGRLPLQMRLDIAPGIDHGVFPAVAHVFVNGQLLRSVRMETGDRHQMLVDFPAGLLGIENGGRVLIQRELPPRDCRSKQQTYPAQVLNSSEFVLGEIGAPRNDFFELVPNFRRDAQVQLPSSFLDDPLNSLPFLVETSRTLLPPRERVTMEFFAGTPQAPSKPFLTIGQVPPAGTTETPVRFDRGRIVVRDRVGAIVLDVNEMPPGVVAQLVSAGTQDGLWIRPTGQRLPYAETVGLNRGNVAFIDDRGVSLAISTRRDTLVEVAYPEQAGWREMLVRFRVWIVTASWVVLSLLLLALLRRMWRRRAPPG
ncbi:MAG: hypothetical protein IT557_02010 [Alphaproteobacteria bacterium]|nr:hypothetical protein [Alphaproteobacteria bacterium]